MSNPEELDYATQALSLRDPCARASNFEGRALFVTARSSACCQKMAVPWILLRCSKRISALIPIIGSCSSRRSPPAISQADIY